MNRESAVDAALCRRTPNGNDDYPAHLHSSSLTSAWPSGTVGAGWNGILQTFHGAFSAAFFCSRSCCISPGFYGVEHIRSRKGPWLVSFDAQAAQPTMTIRQPALGIDGFRVVFDGANTNGLTSGEVRFDNPKLNAQSMDKTPESSQELKQKAFPRAVWGVHLSGFDVPPRCRDDEPAWP